MVSAMASALTTQSNGIGTAHSLRDSRSDLLDQQNPNAWKRSSASVAEAYGDLVGRVGHTNEVLAARPAGDKTSMGQYMDSKRLTQYYEDQFRYKDNEAGSTRERVQRGSPVIAELRTNVIIKDEFTIVTDLSYHLAQRYTRPDTSIMIRIDHSACLALGGTFDPCYILTITAVPSQMGPATNKRNAALIQSFMAEILSVPSDRGIVKFQPIEECNYATNGTTILGEIERLEKNRGEEGTVNSVRRVVTAASRKSMSNFNERSLPKMDADMNTANGATTANPTNTDIIVESRRKSVTGLSPPAESAIPNVFELDSNERPSTSHSTIGGGNGLRMNGISKEDLSKSWNKRPKSYSGQSPVSIEDQIKSDQMPKLALDRSRSPQNQSSRHSTKGDYKNTNTPIFSKPSQLSRPSSTHRTKSGLSSKADFDNVIHTNARNLKEKFDPKIDAKTAERNRQIESHKDTAANTARRRSTVTATPKIPAPPPIPVTRSREPKVGKRKSFLSAFRRSNAA